MNQEIQTLIEILNEKKELIENTFKIEALNKEIVDQMNLEVQQLDMTFLKFFDGIKASHGDEAFKTIDVFTRTDLIKLQESVKSTQEAEAVLLERLNREEFSKLKQSMNENKNVSKGINKYKKQFR